MLGLDGGTGVGVGGTGIGAGALVDGFGWNWVSAAKRLKLASSSSFIS